jgi:hypothetical protein
MTGLMWLQQTFGLSAMARKVFASAASYFQLAVIRELGIISPRKDAVSGALDSDCVAW